MGHCESIRGIMGQAGTPELNGWRYCSASKVQKHEKGTKNNPPTGSTYIVKGV